MTPDELDDQERKERPTRRSFCMRQLRAILVRARRTDDPSERQRLDREARVLRTEMHSPS